MAKRPRISAHKFRSIQDEELGLDNIDMARLLGLKLAKRSNAIRAVERFRNGDVQVPGTVATILWFARFSEAVPAWWPELPEME